MLLGIILLVITGGSWVVIGAVVGKAAKDGVPVGVIQAMSAVVTILVSTAVLICRPDSACGWQVRLGAMGSIYLSGFLNYFVINLMGRAMKTGPNGIVWSVVQAALVFPFLVGVIFFHVALTWPRMAGLAAIVVALILFGLAKNNAVSGDDGRWRWAMFGAFLLAGINQNLSNLPSYFPEAAAVSSVSRSLSAALGTFSAYVIVLRSKLWSAENIGWLRNVKTWRFMLLLVSVGLVNGYLLMYRGFNLVAEAGAGAISYPVMISSCIISFSLYSLLILRERFTPAQFAALVVGVVGIVGICL